MAGAEQAKCIAYTFMHDIVCNMEKRTNIVLDERLVRQGLKVTGIKTRRALVHHALSELVRREKQMGFLSLKGKIRWTGDLNKMRHYRFS